MGGRPPGNSVKQVESRGGVLFGCEYTSLDFNSPDSGLLVISTYTADAPPYRLDRSRPVNLGDEARIRALRLRRRTRGWSGGGDFDPRGS